jgi:hypothetical protein
VITHHYAPLVVGQTSQGITITLLLVPTFIALLVKNDTQIEWHRIFLVEAAILVATKKSILLSSPMASRNIGHARISTRLRGT